MRHVSLSFRALLCLAWLLLASSGRAGAEGQLLRVVYTEWFPYTFTENGHPAGFEIDILSTVLARMHLTASFQPLPWKRCLASLESGKADMLVSMLHTPEREAYACYPTEHISESRTCFFVKADSPIVFNGDYEALKRHSIGVILGFSYGAAFDAADLPLKDESVDARVLIEKIMAGRIELAAENRAVVSAEAKRLGVADKIRFLSPDIHFQKLYVGFSRVNKLEALCHAFSRQLVTFKSTEEYTRIMTFYGVQREEP